MIILLTYSWVVTIPDAVIRPFAYFYLFYVVPEADLANYTCSPVFVGMEEVLGVIKQSQFIAYAGALLLITRFFVMLHV